MKNTADSLGPKSRRATGIHRRGTPEAPAPSDRPTRRATASAPARGPGSSQCHRQTESEHEPTQVRLTPATSHHPSARRRARDPGVGRRSWRVHRAQGEQARCRFPDCDQAEEVRASRRFPFCIGSPGFSLGLSFFLHRLGVSDEALGSRWQPARHIRSLGSRGRAMSTSITF